MKIKRIVSNVETAHVEKANAFYHDILGLRLVMDHGWIRTYGSDDKDDCSGQFCLRRWVWHTCSGYVY